MSNALEIDIQSVKTMLDDGEDFVLLDCREQHEFETARIDGATLVPMSELQERVSELDSHKERQVVVYCHHGARSLRVAMWLRGQDFAQAVSMAGGIDEWSQVIDPSVPRY